MSKNLEDIEEFAKDFWGFSTQKQAMFFEYLTREYFLQSCLWKIDENKQAKMALHLNKSLSECAKLFLESLVK